MWLFTGLPCCTICHIVVTYGVLQHSPHTTFIG